MNPMNVILETGKKKTFASALDWPGWSRNGRDEESAMQALADYGPRYARVLLEAGIDFEPPADRSAFFILERVDGNATTDFGAPAISAEVEKEPIDLAAFQRYKALMQAYWQAFDRVVRQAEGKELQKGPRGGGRNLENIIQHVLGADQGYLRSVGWRPEKGEEKELEIEIKKTREAILDTLKKAAKEGLPEHGPRGGKIWPARYFVRRSGWHVLDHAWEIEDRTILE